MSVRPRTGGAAGSAAPRVGASPRRAPSPRRSPSQGSDRPSSRDGRNPGVAVPPLSARGAAGNYRNGDLCEFWSNSHNEWLPAQVVNTDASGRLIIDLKPNTWLTKEDQAAKIRPRKTAAAQAANRPPQIGGSPQLPRPPLHRSPSWGSGVENRAPSPGGGRAPSPSGRGQGGFREMTPIGGRAPSPAGRAASPSGRPLWAADRPMTPSRRGRESPGRAASPRGYVGANGIARPPRLSASPLRAGGAHIVGPGL